MSISIWKFYANFHLFKTYNVDFSSRKSSIKPDSGGPEDEALANAKRVAVEYASTYIKSETKTPVSEKRLYSTVNFTK